MTILFWIIHFVVQNGKDQNIEHSWYSILNTILLNVSLFFHFINVNVTFNVFMFFIEKWFNILWQPSFYQSIFFCLNFDYLYFACTMYRLINFCLNLFRLLNKMVEINYSFFPVPILCELSFWLFVNHPKISF